MKLAESSLAEDTVQAGYQKATQKSKQDNSNIQRTEHANCEALLWQVDRHVAKVRAYREVRKVTAELVHII